MKKGFLVILLISFFSCYISHAQSLEDTTLNEVVVTAGRSPGRYIQTARSVTIIDSLQLKQLPARSINEILENFAGVDLRSRGPAGVQADVSIRGESFENVLILIDGVRVNDPQTGHHNLNLPLPLDEIERIEILRGPAARIHGQNAFSGVINFITKKPGEANIKVKTVVGDFDFYQAMASVSAPVKNYKQNFSASRTSSNGYRHNTDFGINHFNYRSYIELPKIDISSHAGLSTRNFGANAFYAAAFPDQWETTQTAFAHVSAQIKGNWQIRPNLYWRRNNDEFLLRRNNPAFYRNYHTSDVFGADVNATKSWRLGTTSLGAEARREQVVSTNLGNRHRYNTGIFAEHTFILWQRLIINPGTFISWYSDYDVQFYPGVDVSYLLRPHFSLYATANRAYRVPTYTELYYKDPANLANPNLQPEEAIAYEAGIRFHKQALKITVAAFQKDGRNIIDWVRADALAPWQVQNYAQLTTRGAEAALTVLPPALFGQNFFVEMINLQFAHINTDKKNTELQSKYALDYLRHHVVIGVQHKLPFGIKQRWAVRYEERVGYAPYWLVDLRMYRNWSNFTFFVEATNLLDHRYFEFGNVYMPGRWVSGGLSWQLK